MVANSSLLLTTAVAVVQWAEGVTVEQVSEEDQVVAVLMEDAVVVMAAHLAVEAGEILAPTNVIPLRRTRHASRRSTRCSQLRTPASTSTPTMTSRCVQEIFLDLTGQDCRRGLHTFLGIFAHQRKLVLFFHGII